MLTNNDILCISTQDWDRFWTRKHRFMLKLAKQGNRVLYIESQASLISISIIKSDWRRMFRWLKGPRRVNENLWVATLPLVLPFFQMYSIVNRINNWFIAMLLKFWLKKLNFKDLILWTYTPFSHTFIKNLGDNFAIYECVDEFSDSKGLINPGVIKQLEKKLLEKVDLVIVTHNNLLQSKKSLNNNIHFIPNGAEVEHFRRTSLKETAVIPEMLKISKPIIGFLGAVQYWIDFDLIRFLVLSRPEWSLVLLGPIGRLAKIEKVRNIPNVHLLGGKNYSTLPSYIKAWDVCINPYIINKTSDNCSPIKLYEYLASGKPIVSVDMPEARKFSNVIAIGTSYEDFLDKVELIVKGLPESQDRIESRIKIAEKHSWDCRFQELENTLEPYLKSSRLK